MTGTGDRRPLASRQTGWASAIAKRLAATSVTPNQISMASMVFAAIAGAAFVATGSAAGGLRAALFIAAAAAIQLRLLCNLFDGMVAIESGKAAPDGPFWNEFPDRIADILIIAGAGYAAGEPVLGWAAAAFAVLTAYVRELGRACGAPSDFSGPMAKPHRMALLTGAAILAALEPLWFGGGEVLGYALWVLAIGTLFTALRRAARLVRRMKANTGSG